jgi:transmembrane sensor
MKESNLKALLKKFFSGKSSPDGEKLANQWFEEQNLPLPPFSEEELQASGERIKERLLKTIQEQKTPVRSLRPGIWLAAASVVVVLMLLGILWRMSIQVQSRQAQALLTVRTGVGEKKTLLLPDGSRVQLNERTTFQYPAQFGSANREVYLAGEAFFEVVRNPKQPFLIQSGKVETRVLGTSFNVKAYPGQPTVEVSVATGKVAVRNKEDNVLVTLLPKQRAVYEPRLRLLRKDTLLLATVGVWREVRDEDLTVKDMPLASLAKLLQERYKVEIILTSPKLKKCLVSGVFRKQPLQEILDAICHQIKGTCTLQSGQYYLSGDGCGK